MFNAETQAQFVNLCDIYRIVGRHRRLHRGACRGVARWSQMLQRYLSRDDERVVRMAIISRSHPRITPALFGHS
jgi:hypothetical protein